MSDALWGNIITAAVTIIGLIIGLAKLKNNVKAQVTEVKAEVKAVVKTQVTEVKDEVKQVHTQINSRMDELLALTKASAYKAGVLQEQQRQKTKDENEKKSKK